VVQLYAAAEGIPLHLLEILVHGQLIDALSPYAVGSVFPQLVENYTHKQK